MVKEEKLASSFPVSCNVLNADSVAVCPTAIVWVLPLSSNMDKNNISESLILIE
jgi:hypothetical protein